MLRMGLFRRSVRDCWWIFLISVHSVAPTICLVHYSSLALVWIQHGVYSPFNLPCLIDWLLSHWLEGALVPTSQNKHKASVRKRKKTTEAEAERKNIEDLKKKKISWSEKCWSVHFTEIIPLYHLLHLRSRISPVRQQSLQHIKIDNVMT